MLLRFYIISLLVTFTINVNGQDSLNFFKPYLLSTHPLGNFTSRINHNFKYAPAKRSINFHISRGNVWLPFVESRLANKATDRALMSDLVWHHRSWEFEHLNITDYKSRNLESDGIFSNYVFNFNSPLSEKFEISTNLRFSSLTGGVVPVSLLTSDEFIEWFHSNIAGGEDAFGRKFQPFGEARLRYKDTNDNEINIEKGDFLMSEISNYINYYPKRKIYGVNINFSLLTGLSQINRTWHFDLGFSSTAIRKFKFKKNWLDWGVSGGVLMPSTFQEQAVIINNRNHLISFESHWNYAIPTKNAIWNIGLNFNAQTSFHKKSETDYYVIMRRELTSHDHMGMSHLHRQLQGWAFVFSRNWSNWTVSCYAREDFWVDNAPDAQVGWGVQRQF